MISQTSKIINGKKTKQKNTHTYIHSHQVTNTNINKDKSKHSMAFTHLVYSAELYFSKNCRCRRIVYFVSMSQWLFCDNIKNEPYLDIVARKRAQSHPIVDVVKISIMPPNELQNIMTIFDKTQRWGANLESFIQIPRIWCTSDCLCGWTSNVSSKKEGKKESQ